MDQWLNCWERLKTKVAPGWTCAPYMHDKLTLILQHNTIYLDNRAWIKEESYELEELDEYSAMNIGKAWLLHRHRTTTLQTHFREADKYIRRNSWPGNTCSDTAGLWPGFFGRKHVRWNVWRNLHGGTGRAFIHARERFKVFAIVSRNPIVKVRQKMVSHIHLATAFGWKFRDHARINPGYWYDRPGCRHMVRSCIWV